MSGRGRARGTSPSPPIRPGAGAGRAGTQARREVRGGSVRTWGTARRRDPGPPRQSVRVPRGRAARSERGDWRARARARGAEVPHPLVSEGRPGARGSDEGGSPLSLWVILAQIPWPSRDARPPSCAHTGTHVRTASGQASAQLWSLLRGCTDSRGGLGVLTWRGPRGTRARASAPGPGPCGAGGRARASVPEAPGRAGRVRTQRARRWLRPSPDA